MSFALHQQIQHRVLGRCRIVELRRGYVKVRAENGSWAAYGRRVDFARDVTR